MSSLVLAQNCGLGRQEQGYLDYKIATRINTYVMAVNNEAANKGSMVFLVFLQIIFLTDSTITENMEA